MTWRFRRETLLPVAPTRAFLLSTDIDAHTGSMAGSQERAVAGVTSGQIRLGERVTWRATHFGLPWRMTSEITSYDAPLCFVDEQVSGPFHRFHHRHTFVPVPDGTRMVDEVELDAPFWLLGDAVERVGLGRYMERLIDERNDYLLAVAERRRPAPA